MTLRTLALVGAALLLPATALAQAPRAPTEPLKIDPMRATTFACETGEKLVMQTVARGSDLVAIVDAGDGRLHELSLKPWVVGDLPQITWSDGMRTLTWSPGVQIMFMDGAKHRDCGGGMHHEH